MRIGIITLACLMSGMMVTTSQAFDVQVGPFINGGYEYGGYSTDDGTGIRVLGLIPLDKAEKFGSGSLGSLGSGSGLGTLGGPPPRLVLELGFDFEQVEDDIYYGHNSQMQLMYGYPSYTYNYSFDLTRYRLSAGVGARHDAGEAFGTPPPESHVYGVLGYGAFVGVSLFDLDYGPESETGVGLDLGAYVSYDYPVLDKWAVGVRADASYLLWEPELGSTDLETDDPLQVKLGAHISYAFD